MERKSGKIRLLFAQLLSRTPSTKYIASSSKNELNKNIISIITTLNYKSRMESLEK